MIINRVQIGLHTFPNNKSFGQILFISPENFIFLRTFNQTLNH